MKNRMFYGCLVLTILGAFVLRSHLIEGPILNVLFANESLGSSKVVSLFEYLANYFVQLYTISINQVGYVFTVILFISLIRLLLIPVETTLFRRRLSKNKLQPELDEIKSSISDFKERAEATKAFFVEKQINPIVDIALLILKVVCLVSVFALVVSQVGSEPEHWNDNRHILAGIIGLFVFPATFLTLRFQPMTDIQAKISKISPVILYIASIAFFSVTLVTLIVIMQLFNAVFAMLGHYFFTETKGNMHHEKKLCKS